MTSPIFMVIPVAKVRWRRKPLAWCAIGTARALVALKPHQLRRALEVLRGGARSADSR